MARRKKLSPSGNKGPDGGYRNVRLDLHKDELYLAGMKIGEEVYVRVRSGKIIVHPVDEDPTTNDY